jgi:DNA end-binding protein Ku
MIATTLSFDYEVRPPATVFDDIAKIAIKGEMLKLAEHIIKSKTGSFDATKFDDRYEAALAEVVRAKQAGEPVKARAPAKMTNVLSLIDALRQSVGGKSSSRTKAAKSAPPNARATRPKSARAAPRRRAAS